MPILPFGCRAFAVKPRESYSKARIEPRAWVGVNLGRSLTLPGAYNIYVPSVPRVVLASEVYFDENTFPWKQGQTSSTAPVATAVADTGQDQPPGFPHAPHGTKEAPSSAPLPSYVPDSIKPAISSRT
eukprot:5625033-Pleurochrysis_carterae.AAC.1